MACQLLFCYLMSKSVFVIFSYYIQVKKVNICWTYSWSLKINIWSGLYLNQKQTLARFICKSASIYKKGYPFGGKREILPPTVEEVLGIFSALLTKDPKIESSMFSLFFFLQYDSRENKYFQKTDNNFLRQGQVYYIGSICQGYSQSYLGDAAVSLE